MLVRKAKHHKIPWISNGILNLSESNSINLKDASPEWFAWLAEAVSFAYDDSDGKFTARMETTPNGGKYWKAYRRHGGKLHSKYLGQATDLDLDLLHNAARQLSPLSMNTNMVRSDLLVDQDNQRKDLHPFTKFLIPPLPTSNFHRPRLFEPFRDPSKSVVWIAAPPNYGKTSLVVDWIFTDQPVVAWVSLDSGDNDPFHFWSAVAISLNAIHAGLASDSVSMLQSVSTQLDHNFVPLLINDLVEAGGKLSTQQPVVLVLDNFQTIENLKIHTDLSVLMTSLPAQFRLVILGQSISQLQVGHLRLNERLVGIGINDLAFQPSEVHGYIQGRIGQDWPDEVVQQLTQQTEGWIGAIQAAISHVQSGHTFQEMIDSFTGSGSRLYITLFEEALSLQPEPVKQFLLITSILDRLCGELCDRLIGEGQRRKQDSLGYLEQRHPSSSQTIINYLVNHNLFLTPADREGVWFRYIPLFAQSLRQRLQDESPLLKSRLHVISARWLDEHDLMPEAIQQALASRDKKYASELIEKGCTIALNQRKFHTLITWLRALPHDVISTNPNLSLYNAIGNVLYGNLNQAQADLSNLDHILLTSGKKTPPDQNLLVRRDVLRAYLTAAANQDFPSAMRLTRSIYRDISEDQYHLRSAVKWVLLDVYNRCDRPVRAEIAALDLVALSQKAENYHEYYFGIGEVASVQITLGKLHAAQHTLEQAHLQAESLGTAALMDEITGEVVSHLAYEQNDLERAWEENSRKIDGGCGETCTPSQRGRALFMLCQLHLARNECFEAHQALDQVDTIYGSPFHPFSAALSAWRTIVWLKQITLGDNPDSALSAAVNWADTISKQDQPGGKYMLHETIWPTHMALARVRLAQDKTSNALTQIETIRVRLEAAHAKGKLIQVLALQSVIKNASGQHTEALKTLQQALTWGESEGYIRSIVDLGSPISTLLADIRTEFNLPIRLNRYVSKLLGVIPNTGLDSAGHSRTEYDPFVHLTSSEMKILKKLSEGYSTSDIAAELFVSENTVKTHINHILNKLHVKRRAQAVHRAIELTILD